MMYSSSIDMISEKFRRRLNIEFEKETNKKLEWLVTNFYSSYKAAVEEGINLLYQEKVKQKYHEEK